MPIRTSNTFTPRTTNTDRIVEDPASGPVATPSPDTVAPANRGWVTGGRGNRPNPVNGPPLQVRASPDSVLKKTDLAPINKRFEKLALDDGQLSRGDVKELVRSLSTRKLSPRGEAELRRAIDQYGSKMTPDARAHLETFLARDLPRLRMASPTDLNREELVGDNSAITTWDAPTQNEDGSSLTNLAGYKIAMGKTPGQYSKVIDVNDPAAAGYVIDGLAGGTWYFAVKAYNTAGEESRYSGEVSKVFP